MVVSSIIPDASMPVIDIGGKKVRAEVVMNPYSTINRKIPAILMETGLSCCAVKIHDKVDELKKTADGRKKIMPMIEHYYGSQYKGMSVTEFIKLHNNKPLEDVYCFKVGSYSDITPETVQSFMEELNVPTEATIEVPEADVTDWKEIEETLGPDEVEKIKAEMTGKFVKIDKPLSYGYVYLERLYHQPQYYGKVVSDLEDVSGRGKQPIAGHGLYRKNGGQKISEICKYLSHKHLQCWKPFLKGDQQHNKIMFNDYMSAANFRRRYSLVVCENMHKPGTFGHFSHEMPNHSFVPPEVIRTVRPSKDSSIIFSVSVLC